MHRVTKLYNMTAFFAACISLNDDFFFRFEKDNIKVPKSQISCTRCSFKDKKLNIYIFIAGFYDENKLILAFKKVRCILKYGNCILI